MKKNRRKILALIPTRLNSRRLPAKSLLPINGLPLIIHVYRRTLLAKKIDEAIICCDDKKIFNTATKFGAKVVMTSKNHINGTDRICAAFKKLKNRNNFDLVVDVQGDEPLLSPNHIDKVIDFHLKNLDADIILPNLRLKATNNTNIVKLVTNKKNEVVYISRSSIPFEFKNPSKFLKKHLSIISFKPDALLKFGKAKVSALEKIEDIELLRAVYEGLKIKTIDLKGDSFSIDIFEDYKKAQKQINKDKYFKFYKH